MEFLTSRPFEGLDVPDKNEFHRYLQIENEKVPGGVILAFLEETIHQKHYQTAKEIIKKLNSLDHHLIQDLHNYAQKLIVKIYENNDLKSWRELMKNPNFLEYCIVLGNTSYYKKMNASTVVNKLQIMADLVGVTLKYKSSDSLSQTVNFNEGKDLFLYCLEYKNKVFFLFPDKKDPSLWGTTKKPQKLENSLRCSVCDNDYTKTFFSHLVCKCQVCDACVLKHDGHKCGKCKKTPKKELLKKFQQEITQNLCAGCQIRVPVSLEKSCACFLCIECVHESPLSCKSCGTDNFLLNKGLEDEWSKKNAIVKFLKDKLNLVTEFEERLMNNIQEMYRIIETSKNSYLKELEGIKKVINDNLNNLADLTLIKCLSLPKNDLDYSLNEAVILQLQSKFEISEFKAFFHNSVVADFSIQVPVCYSCHVHLFTKPMKLTNCSCNLCKDCVKKHFRVSKNCPCCSSATQNFEELELYCGEKFNLVCKGCYQDKSISVFIKCPKGCISCKDCHIKYKDPNPICPLCNEAVGAELLGQLIS